MTREEAIRIIKIVLVVAENFEITVQGEEFTEEKCKEAVDIAIEALKTDPLEVEESKLQKSYNKGFQDGIQTVKESDFMRICRKCGLEYCGYSKCPRCGGDQYDLHYIK